MWPPTVCKERGRHCESTLGARGFSCFAACAVGLRPKLRISVHRAREKTSGTQGTVIVKCLAQEQNIMTLATLARARVRTAKSVVERTNHDATTPPQWGILLITNFYPETSRVTFYRSPESETLRHMEKETLIRCWSSLKTINVHVPWDRQVAPRRAQGKISVRPSLQVR